MGDTTVRRESLAQRNGTEVQRILMAREGYADLYRTVVAGPSGQRGDLLIARVRYTWERGFEFAVVNMNRTSPDYGTVCGYARRADVFERQRHPGAEWCVHDYDDYEGCRWLGYAGSLALGCDVLLNGVHAATGRHDSRRVSGGTWIPNPDA